MENMTGEALAKRVDIGEVTTFRLHWLLCDLWDLQRTIANARFGSTAADLSTGVHSELVKTLDGIAGKYRQLRWETKTILGFDYDDEVQPLFDHLAKHAEYLQELEKVKDILRHKAEQILEAESKRLNDALDKLAKY